MPASQLLLHLVADLVRAEVNRPRPDFPNGLIDAFKKNPEEVMNAYGLEAEARFALFTMDRQVIAYYILQELLRTPAPPPPKLWSDPSSKISGFAPPELVAAPGQRLTIQCDCVMSTAEVHLVAYDTFQHYVTRPTFDPFPPNLMDQKVIATFDLTGARLDEYWVEIYNSPGAVPVKASDLLKVVAPKP